LVARAGVHRVLPVVAALAPLFPQRGLERGLVHAVRGDAAPSLVYALVAGATVEGAWCALVDVPHAGLSAAREMGVSLERTVCVDTDRGATSGGVIGALVEGFGVVVVGDPACPPAEARKVVSRAKAQGAVIVLLGAAGAFPVDVELTVRTRGWCFSACATERRVDVSIAGRRVHRESTASLFLPSSAGCALAV
jgi:hypothetical protein